LSKTAVRERPWDDFAVVQQIQFRGQELLTKITNGNLTGDNSGGTTGVEIFTLIDVPVQSILPSVIRQSNQFAILPSGPRTKVPRLAVDGFAPQSSRMSRERKLRIRLNGTCPGCSFLPSLLPLRHCQMLAQPD